MPLRASPDPVALHARLQPDRLACTDLATGRHWTYAALHAAIQRMATVLATRLGLSAGRRVAVLARNSADLVILQQACLRRGLIFVPLNWRLSRPELEAILADCEPSLLVHDSDEGAIPLPDGRTLPLAELVAWAEDSPPADPVPLPDAGAPSIILYTSGTSGRPKGVIITEANAMATAVNFGVLGRVSHRSVFLCDSPMFHVIGLITSVRSPLLAGGSMLISSGFDPAATNGRLGDPALGATHYFCVPQMAKRLREQANFDPGRWRTLTALFTGGAPNPAADIRWWLERGVPMVDGFGMTEAGTVLGMPIEPGLIAAKAGAAGLPAPMIECRLVDEAGQDVPAGEAGELLLSGPSITPGYWNRPEETRRAFTGDGWFRTGDIGRRDADGYVTLVDRRKDMFISGGENVYPAEVEIALGEHPDVQDVAVLGVADATWGEVGRAFIVPRAGRDDIPAQSLIAHCESRLARYKIPKEFIVVESLPRTASGKLQKHVLRRDAG
ncbi:AMP-binding protein [Roseomonas gilardii]|uniref:AMP-binding protein n=1 Tax=Roseomonas gilardii TaxID=257708 RepID=UPI0011A4F71F|nr:AMP-binding protein [Roseomonas gilardii]